jgi:hypothetical protein
MGSRTYSRRQVALFSLFALGLLVHIPATRVLAATPAPWTATLAATPAPQADFCSAKANDLPPAGKDGPNFDCISHVRSPSATPPSMQAQHGADCSGYPNTHATATYENTFFLCNGHVMTAIFSQGYGEAVMTPNHLVDISGGTATVQYTVSARRTSFRDWYDIWFTPFAENLLLPIDGGHAGVDLQGPPKDGFHIILQQTACHNGQAGTSFVVEEMVNYVRMAIKSNTYQCVEELVSVGAGPDPKNVVPYEIAFNATNITFKLTEPAAGITPGSTFTFANKAVFPTSLSSTQYVFQITHHSYNPAKDCTPGGGYMGEIDCTPNTWHWGKTTTIKGVTYPGLQISPAVPFTLDKANLDFFTGAGNAIAVQAVSFNTATPSGAHLRFSALGNVTTTCANSTLACGVSFDGGATWHGAAPQAQSFNDTSKFSSYWTPIPAGLTSALIRISGPVGNAGVGSMVADPAVWAQAA